MITMKRLISYIFIALLCLGAQSALAQDECFDGEVCMDEPTVVVETIEVAQPVSEPIVASETTGLVGDYSLWIMILLMLLLFFVLPLCMILMWVYTVHNKKILKETYESELARLREENARLRNYLQDRK